MIKDIDHFFIACLVTTILLISIGITVNITHPKVKQPTKYTILIQDERRHSTMIGISLETISDKIAAVMSEMITEDDLNSLVKGETTTEELKIKLYNTAVLMEEISTDLSEMDYDCESEEE